jgi:hypothetical protein
MISDPTRCSDCGAEMELGFLPDVTQAGALQQKWVRGPVEEKWIGGVKTKGALPVETYRCKNCGLLKSYAK